MTIFGDLFAIIAGATVQEAVQGKPPGTVEWLGNVAGDATAVGIARMLEPGPASVASSRSNEQDEEAAGLVQDFCDLLLLERALGSVVAARLSVQKQNKILNTPNLRVQLERMARDNAGDLFDNNPELVALL
ncbi:hypothetical protein, partial [Mycobacteroides chelonae]|uniref:hypothetical protein n=1 Tax=Mycobacteroides chelonae TaxID=1774 RepID=UPI00104236C3